MESCAGMSGMAGMRNVLVHGYLELDQRTVWEMMATRLGDFDASERHALRIIENG